MWIYAHEGFYAIVEDRKDADYLWVRCRDRKDMEVLVTRYMSDHATTDDIIHNEDADYPYRLKLRREVIADAFMRMLADIDYDTLKASLHRNERVADRYGMYHDVWTATLPWDDEDARPSGRGNPADPRNWKLYAETPKRRLRRK